MYRSKIFTKIKKNITTLKKNLLKFLLVSKILKLMCIEKKAIKFFKYIFNINILITSKFHFITNFSKYLNYDVDKAPSII